MSKKNPDETLPWRSRFLLPEDFSLFDPFSDEIADIPEMDTNRDQPYHYIFMSPDTGLADHYSFVAALSPDQSTMQKLDSDAGPIIFIGVTSEEDAESLFWSTTMDRQINSLYINGHPILCGDELMDSGKVEQYV